MSNPSAKPRRNEACPCGSGRKYKHCCGAGAARPGASGTSRAAPARPPSALASPEIIELMSLSQAGRYADLERRAREQIQRHPGAGLPWKALTVALRMQGRDPLPSAQRAVELLPEDADAQNHLGQALLEAGRAAEAAARFAQALRLKPDDLAGSIRLGKLLSDMGRLEEAAACFTHALTLNPDLLEVRYRLGIASLGLGRFAQAVTHLERAVELRPGSAELHVQLATALRMLGRTQEAEAQFRRALELDPLLPDALAGIAQLRTMTAGDAAWLDAAQRALQAPGDPRAELTVRYATGKYFDDLGEYGRAFEAFERANQIARAQVRRFDPVQLDRDVANIIAAFGPRWLGEARNPARGGARAVFIVGMPRAGCPLLGWLLSGHPGIGGAGELRFWTDAAGYYDAAARRGEPTGALLDRLSAEYLRLLQAAAPQAQRAIDQMPGNFARLGLIHASLPEARIIHVRRDPIDTCLGLFSQDSGGALSYAHSLDDLAHYYRQYLRIMQHWRSMLPAGVLLEIEGEQLISDQETCCRRVVEFLELPWDEHCLEAGHAQPLPPHLRIAPSGHWRHYSAHLGPLLELQTLSGPDADR